MLLSRALVQLPEAVYPEFSGRPRRPRCTASVVEGRSLRSGPGGQRDCRDFSLKRGWVPELQGAFIRKFDYLYQNTAIVSPTVAR